MVFGLTWECPCCREHLHHCEKCWNRFHNGIKHQDYVLPAYFGESMMDEDTKKKIQAMGVNVTNPFITADKTRKYKEGEYH